MRKSSSVVRKPIEFPNGSFTIDDVIKINPASVSKSSIQLALQKAIGEGILTKDAGSGGSGAGRPKNIYTRIMRDSPILVNPQEEVAV